MLGQNRALLDESARALLAKETLADGELQAVLGKVLPEDGRVAAAGAMTR